MFTYEVFHRYRKGYGRSLPEQGRSADPNRVLGSRPNLIFKLRYQRYYNLRLYHFFHRNRVRIRIRLSELGNAHVYLLL
jgi:hypothetical protein